LIRAVYRRVVPARLRDVLWKSRSSLRHWYYVQHAELRARYRRYRFRHGMLATERPAGFPDESWTIETDIPNAMRRSWVRKVVCGQVLDVGCNRGYASCVMALSADSVMCVDISPEDLASASELASMCGIKNIQFQHGDAYSLPFADKSFDTVTLLEVLEHLERPEVAVSEALRVARRRVVITVPAKGHMTETPGHIWDFAVQDIVSMLPSADYAEQHAPFTFVLHKVGSD